MHGSIRPRLFSIQAHDYDHMTTGSAVVFVLKCSGIKGSIYKVMKRHLFVEVA